MIEENELLSRPTDAYVSGRIDARVAAGLLFTQAGSQIVQGASIYLSTRGADSCQLIYFLIIFAFIVTQALCK